MIPRLSVMSCGGVSEQGAIAVVDSVGLSFSRSAELLRLFAAASADPPRIVSRCRILNSHADCHGDSEPVAYGHT